MPKRRKEGNKFTTISISWDDKIKLRKLAKFKRETKNGKLYETDAEIFTRMISTYAQQYGLNSQPKPTYPTVLQDKHQPD